MIIKCSVCHRKIEDETRWTICPHGPIWAGVSDYCTMHDLVISQSNGICTQACKDAAVQATATYDRLAHRGKTF